MKIHCAACGKLIEHGTAWDDSLSRTKVCGKKCLDKIRHDYSEMIVEADGGGWHGEREI